MIAPKGSSFRGTANDDAIGPFAGVRVLLYPDAQATKADRSRIAARRELKCVSSCYNPGPRDGDRPDFREHFSALPSLARHRRCRGRLLRAFRRGAGGHGHVPAGGRLLRPRRDAAGLRQRLYLSAAVRLCHAAVFAAAALAARSGLVPRHRGRGHRLVPIVRGDRAQGHCRAARRRRARLAALPRLVAQRQAHSRGVREPGL